MKTRMFFNVVNLIGLIVLCHQLCLTQTVYGGLRIPYDPCSLSFVTLNDKSKFYGLRLDYISCPEALTKTRLLRQLPNNPDAITAANKLRQALAAMPVMVFFSVCVI